MYPKVQVFPSTPVTACVAEGPSPEHRAGTPRRVEGPLYPPGGSRMSGPDRRRVTRSGQTYRQRQVLRGRVRKAGRASGAAGSVYGVRPQVCRHRGLGWSCGPGFRGGGCCQPHSRASAQQSSLTRSCQTVLDHPVDQRRQGALRWRSCSSRAL